ncbi:MAG: SPASM domain-containing protein [Candidatus Staskawiczbacteria bacterium]|nr:SPASM domain-containing protein [Candidatus Staskawiczbacteria bacterium]
MKAKDVSGQAPGGKRVKLSEVLPLKTPILVQIFPIYACNFKCNYCTFSVGLEKRGFISDKVSMDIDLFKRCVDDMTNFPDKIKTLRFVGMGEPLLHKDIAKMVEYAVLKNIAKKVEILTNGSLLTNELSDALIKAGLSRLLISIQGTTKEKYKEVSKIDIDFEKFVGNLKYFFVHSRGKAQLHIKIIDYALENKKDEKKFYEIFGDISDTIGIEHAGPIFPGVHYNSVLEGKEAVTTQFGLPIFEVKICPQPFFHMQINPDGKAVPCYSLYYPIILGDCRNESVYKIWNGKKYNDFRRKMLEGVGYAGKVCENCEIIRHRLFPEDLLNNDADRLKKFYE